MMKIEEERKPKYLNTLNVGKATTEMLVEINVE